MKRAEEDRELAMQRSRLEEETTHEKQDKELKRIAFVQANNMLCYEKQIANAKEEEEKLLDRVNYFPFTHGDTIEK